MIQEWQVQQQPTRMATATAVYEQIGGEGPLLLRVLDNQGETAALLLAKPVTGTKWSLRPAWEAADGTVMTSDDHALGVLLSVERSRPGRLERQHDAIRAVRTALMRSQRAGVK